MSGELRSRRILITRPAHQSRGWRAQLEAAGATVDSIPMLAIEAIDSGPEQQAIKNHILNFDLADHSVFVSQNAVRIGFDWIEDYWPQLPKGPRYYAVGAATARALRERGVPVEADGDTMDSEALLALPALRDIAGQRALIFRGRGGRTLIGETLRQRGARVDYCELYRRLLPPDAPQQLAAYAQQPDAISVHSGETLANLAQCIGQSGRESLRDALLVCPSRRVAEQARELGFARVRAARNAGDSAMLEALRTGLAGRLR
ncbi:uroporphyrinogen-III synthase [Microbulbifer sp.]|uniref:uroporphyrinogen-III synthase n=1 Tax=Microbulbifer sp. TaxID=1908541 RepID=UPI003F32D947